MRLAARQESRQMRISLDVQGTTVLSRELIGMGHRALDVSPAMSDVRDIVWESNTKQFDSQGSHGSGGWTRPSDEWTARKLELDLDPRAEAATQDMRKSLTGRRRGSYTRARKNGLDMGSTIPYVQYAIKRNKIVSPTEAERREMVKVVQRFIVESRGRTRTPILAGAL